MTPLPRCAHGHWPYRCPVDGCALRIQYDDQLQAEANAFMAEMKRRSAERGPPVINTVLNAAWNDYGAGPLMEKWQAETVLGRLGIDPDTPWEEFCDRIH